MFEIIYICKVGILAGIIMGMAAMILNLVKFTTLDLTAYMGCLLTKRSSGMINFIAGFSFHLFASAALALVYVFVIGMFQISLTFVNGLIAGCVHTLVSGCLLPQLDRFNACVKKGTLPKMGYFASNYGANAMITFTAGHIIYAVIVFWMLA
ncbi:MAG: hypothetical protein NTZ68_03460 [Candidatus Dependentiae bacterium]|nr:hypothetical protein [Candidatus Dependentiae bacterium]